MQSANQITWLRPTQIFRKLKNFIQVSKILLHKHMLRLPVIPQELFDMIFDFLYNDVAALCSAGLVCKSWLPVSRFHLFSEIFQEISARELHGLELICAERSTIPPYILKLKIADDENQFLDESLLRLPLLSKVERLLLTQVNMANLTPNAKTKIITSWLKNLTTSDLYAVTVRNYFSLNLDSF